MISVDKIGFDINHYNLKVIELNNLLQYTIYVIFEALCSLKAKHTYISRFLIIGTKRQIPQAVHSNGVDKLQLN